MVVASSATAASIPPPRATPVLGWNAWNTFSTNGKPDRGGRKEYETVVEAMIESGMVKAGYTFMGTVCTGWTGRDPVTRELQQNLTNWPGGMKSFSDYLHTKGMTLSVYTDAGVKNCCGEPGSLGFEDIDMKTFASWGADAVGIDYCGGPTDVQGEYEKFASAIAKSGRSMQLGIWNLGKGAAYKWAPAMSVNLTAATQTQPGVFHGAWVPAIRLTRDIGNMWDGTGGPTESVMALVDQIQAIPDLWSYGLGNTSGTFPNYGQMVVGVPKGHPSSPDLGLTLVEAQSHFSLWAMFGSLMLATNDIRKRDKDIEAILMNRETLAISQDPWAVPSFRITNRNCSGMKWARHLANGDIAALVLNRNSKNGDPATHTRLDFADVAPSGSAMSYLVRDMQANKDLGVACSSVSFVLQPHETAFVRLTPAGPCKAPVHPPPCTAPRPPPPRSS